MKICAIKNCFLPSGHHTYCPMHCYRMKRYGTPDLPIRIRKICSVPHCTNISRSRGLCNMHRIRLKIKGSVGTPYALKQNGGVGYLTKTGYRYFYKPSHPNASKNGQIAEHIIVMVSFLKRPLIQGESVHHKNGIRSDNRIENLELRSSEHPSGQSVSEMVEFCIQYLDKYRNVVEKFNNHQAKEQL